MNEVVQLQTEQLKAIVIDALDDLKAQQILTIDVREQTSVTDIMVIATARSSRQLKSLATYVVEKVKEQGIQPIGTEGENDGEWALVDLGDVVVHIMSAETRAFYNLEKLWSGQFDDAVDASAGDDS